MEDLLLRNLLLIWRYIEKVRQLGVLFQEGRATKLGKWHFLQLFPKTVFYKQRKKKKRNLKEKLKIFFIFFVTYPLSSRQNHNPMLNLQCVGLDCIDRWILLFSFYSHSSKRFGSIFDCQGGLICHISLPTPLLSPPLLLSLSLI